MSHLRLRVLQLSLGGRLLELLQIRLGQPDRDLGVEHVRLRLVVSSRVYVSLAALGVAAHLRRPKAVLGLGEGQLFLLDLVLIGPIEQTLTSLPRSRQRRLGTGDIGLGRAIL